MRYRITSVLILLAALATNVRADGERIALCVVLPTLSDLELLVDYNAMEKWRREKGSSDGFYKENGPKRIAAWKDAAKRGSPKGMILYARCLQEGTGVAKDAAEAVRWFRKAVELGNTTAMNNLGWCYFTGEGVAKAEAEADKWFRKAAELGDAGAMYALGRFYLEPVIDLCGVDIAS